MMNLEWPWSQQGFATLDRASWLLGQAREDREEQEETKASHLSSQLPRGSRKASGSRLTLGKENRKSQK